MTTHPEKVLVTGASGSLGRQLLYEMTSTGYNPIPLIRKDSNSAYIDSLGLEKRYADLRDKNALSAAVAGIDMIIHTAAWVNFRQDRLTQFTGINTFGAVNLYEAARKADVRRFVQVSSVAAVGAVLRESGHVSTPITEDFAFNLSHLRIPYIMTKHAAEIELERLAGSGGAPELVIVNPAIIVAPSRTGDDRGKATKLLGRPFLPRVATTINVVDIRDVAPAVIAALHKGRAGQRYILGGENVTVRQLVCDASEILGIKPPRLITLPRILLNCSARVAVMFGTLTGRGKISFYPDLVRLIDYDWAYSSQKAKDDLGFSPRPLRRTLTDLLTNNLVGTYRLPERPGNSS